ncbi:phosphoribosyl-ATP pyrophosphohydrolase [Paenibacillus odorifer]|jgi:predicted house-cleaning noncanonical NTP pyrophosphatase (MazG superfamily)|uniref:nucleoside triphosphate pyrophosphohydrolase n=1 Tax=Paenibacillus TaxID=44249 RepID=UPI00096C1091|nr:nucleoside triphosphate pyrophosphohydrolase [Paenibacillus odorifer]OMD88941.1 phosphoribosyl-ATP pyrophosphohydrolase [Paenibacillus odorifer]
MPVYEKLVRDGIPDLIASQGKDFNTRILESKEYITELRKKLQEESKEYFQAASDEEALEELADMLEVIQALAETHGSNSVELEKQRAEKAKRRGGFKKGIYLIEVEGG